jgi:hypothetical protein
MKEKVRKEKRLDCADLSQKRRKSEPEDESAIDRISPSPGAW